MPAEVLPAYWQSRSSRRDHGFHDLLTKLPKPCGLFAPNDVTACYVIENARACGIRIPQDLGVIGVDNDPIPNAAAGLSISSVEPPFHAIGLRAAQMVNRMARGESVDSRSILSPIRVVVRTSTDVFMVNDPLVQRAQAYIEEHRSRPMLVANVARAAGATTVTLGKHFQQHLKIAPSDYILHRRIEHAKELLREGHLNVEQVSDACGFHSCSYFCQIFKRATGATPGSFQH